MAHQVFICHSSHDKSVADAACAALEAKHIGCWIAPRNITAGVEYGSAIIDALSSCAIVVLIFSAHSNDSPQVRREIERAVSKDKIIVPFRIDEGMPSNAMEYALSNTHWLDARRGPLEDRLTELCKAVAELIAGRAPAHSTTLQQQVKPPTSASPPTPKARPRGILYTAAAALLVLALVAVLFFLRRSSPAPLSAGTQWEQLTFFTDSAVYPALSSDGRMLAFIRGSNPFIGPGDVYVKLLPGGEPIQLTHDGKAKLAPMFLPDNSRIAYSQIDPWDTWQVPVLGGAPQLLLPNSSSMSWIEGGKRLLFSEIKEGLHLAVVTSDAARGNSRDVYVPPGNRSMAHHSYLSPDGKSVLIVEMDTLSHIIPCRVVPFKGAQTVTVVGPPNGSCSSGAWSPDGKWIYLTIKTDDFHIWRQRFPGGKPEQLTFGPTSQAGIAMAADGKSFITSVGSQDHSVWLHDKDGDHEISSEGDTSSPTLSPDGQNLYYLRASNQTGNSEIWVKNLSSGKVDRVLPDYPIQASADGHAYSISPDGKEIAFAMTDQAGRSAVWVAPTSHRSSPRQLSSTAVEDSPFFLPGGDLIFRAVEGGLNYLYRMKPDGTGRRKIIPERILEVQAVSPDGRWVLAGSPNSSEELTASVKAIALDGSASAVLCVVDCSFSWEASGKSIYISFPGSSPGTYVMPVQSDGLPKLSSPITGRESLSHVKEIPWNVESALNPVVYAYTRENTRRNLYRIPLQ